MTTEMNQSVRMIRWGLVSVALLISLVTLLSQTGAIQIACNEYCARIRDWPLSPIVSILAIAGLMTIAYSLKINDERLFRNLALAGLAIALSFQVLAISWQGVCALCMGLAFIVFGLAITSIPRAGWSYVALAPALFGLIVVYDEFGPPSVRESARIAFRPYESSPGQREHGYIVYIDPEDNASRLLVASTNETTRPDVLVYYRWRLTPETEELSMRSVIAIETVNSKKPEIAALFRRAVLTMSASRTDQAIVDVARKFEVEEIVAAALKSPSSEISLLVEADQKEFAMHDLDEFPAVLALAHDGTGRAHPASTALLVNLGDPNLIDKATSPAGGE